MWVGGMKTISITRKEFAQVMLSDCKEARKNYPNGVPKSVFSSNGQGVALYGKDKEFRKVMDRADIIHADGMSVVYGSRLFYKKGLPERIGTTDFFHDVAEVANRHKLRFYMLGGKPEQNEKVVKAVKDKYPNIIICGHRHGYFAEEENEDICKNIVDSKTDVLWVALGKPKQEFWVDANKDNLKGVGWIKTCGGLYAFLTNEVKRAPKWMQNCGLEWLFRAFQEPRRLAKRYFLTNPYSIYRILRYSGGKLS